MPPGGTGGGIMGGAPDMGGAPMGGGTGGGRLLCWPGGIPANPTISLLTQPCTNIRQS